MLEVCANRQSSIQCRDETPQHLGWSIQGGLARARKAGSRRAGRHSQSTANRLFDDALSLASTLADSRKRAGADKIVEFAEATRHFGATLDDEFVRYETDGVRATLMAWATLR